MPVTTVDTGEYDRRCVPQQDFEIQKLTEPGRQIKEMAEIYENAYRDYPEYADTLGRDIFGYLESFWEQSSPDILVAESGGEMLGFIIVDNCWRVHDGKPVGEVHEFAVDYRHRGCKIGSTLLKTGIDYLENNGLERIGLWVGNNNKPAFSMYLRNGFRKVFSERKWTKMLRRGKKKAQSPNRQIINNHLLNNIKYSEQIVAL